MRRFSYLFWMIFLLCSGIIFTSCNINKFEVDNFQQKIRKNPNEADEQYNLGLAYSILGRHNEAVIALEKAIDLNPNDPEANFLLEKPTIVDVNFALVREGKANPDIMNLFDFVPTE